MNVRDRCPALRILITEDEAIIALALRHVVESLGHQVCGVVATAADAVTQAGRLDPDLILMDIMLRGPGDGIEAAEEILARFGRRCIFMSAVDSVSVRERAARARPLGFLRKPYRVEELRRILDAHVAEQHQSTARDSAMTGQDAAAGL